MGLAEREIERVNWGQFTELAGSAERVGLALQRLLSAPTAEEATECYWQLENHVVAQASIFEAAEPTVSVLVAASDGGPQQFVHCRIQTRKAAMWRFATWRPDSAARRMRLALRLQEAVEPGVAVEASETLGLAASILDIGLSVDYYNRFQHAAQLLVAADLAGFSHRSLALLAATIQLAEKEDGTLHGLEPLVRSADHPLLSPAAAVLVVADAMERLIDGAALVWCTRDGRVLKLATSVVEPWPLQEPLRRLGQVYELDVRLDLDVAARAA